MNARTTILLSCLALSCSPMSTADGGATGGGAAAGGSAAGGAAAGGSAGGGSAAGGAAAGGSTGGGAAAGGSAAGGSAGGSSGCTPACGTGRTCCNGTCRNTANDPLNCGACDVTCSGATPFCGGSCMAAPCSIDAGVCQGGQTCCGATCCGAGQLCCDRQGPVSGVPVCFTPTAQQPTCEQGCAPLCMSDRNLKTDVRPIDERQVLERVAALPLSTWRYSSDPGDVRHLGPMAQDFRSAFGLGDTEKGYHSIDAHGVSLASIKALFEMVQEQELRLRRLEAENARLRAASSTCKE